MRTINDNRGYLLGDLLVGLLLTAFVAQATMMVLSTNTRVQTQQDMTADLEQNLRMGMQVLSDALRTAGYGAPSSNYSTWIPWVTGLSSGLTITSGPPATISVARCTSMAVAYLTAAATRGSTSVMIASNVPDKAVSAVLDTGNKRLIFIGGNEFAHITKVSGSTLTVDTSTITKGEQGLSKAYPAGTPICRVDVLTFSINSSTKNLMLNENQGNGSQPLADQISNLKITTVEAGARYEIEMTALSDKYDPVTKAKLTRTLRSDVMLRNTL